MALTLYGAILSPFVRKIRIQLAEQAIPYELVPQMPSNQPDWYYEISPMGRIPAIKDGDLTLADSAVIAQYLQDTRNGPSLYGNNPAEAAKVRWFEKYADYELAPLATFTVFRNRIVFPASGKACDETLVKRAVTEGLPPLFDYLEAQLGERMYLVGDQFSMADIAVCSQLISMAHAGELIDEYKWPGLSSLLSRVTARSSASDLLPQEHQLIAKMSGRS